jgi:hypothetical protein
MDITFHGDGIGPAVRSASWHRCGCIGKPLMKNGRP